MTPLLPGNEELAAGKARAVLRPREGLTGRRRSPNYCRKKEKFGHGERAWVTLLAKRRPGTKKVPQWDLQWGIWARAAFETRTASQSRDTGQRCCVLLPSGPLPITPQKVGPGAEPHSSSQRIPRASPCTNCPLDSLICTIIDITVLKAKQRLRMGKWLVQEHAASNWLQMQVNLLYCLLIFTVLIF